MESLMEMTPETECASLTAPIWQDVLAQAVTGELVAAMNYEALAGICDDPEEVEQAREHSAIERSHAVAFASVGRNIGVDVVSNVDGKHWKRLRESFMRCIAERDVTACLLIQEIMLESLALASYTRVAKVAPGTLGRVFGAIAADEQKHAEHAIAVLKAERDA